MEYSRNCRTFASGNKKEKSFKTMTITDIIWDTDNENVALPTEVEVEDQLTDEEVADYLSDTYGYLVEGFAMPMTDDDRDYFGEFVNKVEAKIS